jgi:acetyl-CoA decarbonylase/synthase complex subunit gamma
MKYTVDPGLYALGCPNAHAPVLVTANYKMSFDRLRESLPGRNAWILVLDTKGINVWCAAGKGTFGTDELVFRIAGSGLKDLVAHRDLIVPQLGAPGTAAHLVKKLSGFRVHYGPVEARDLPAYLDAGMKAAPDMRVKKFPLRDRTALIPIELTAGMKIFALIVPVLIAVAGFSGNSTFLGNVKSEGVFMVLAIIGGIFAGTVLTPLLLPYLPGRAFAVKGLAGGVATFALLFSICGSGYNIHSPGRLAWLGSLLLITSALAAFLAMNFTGSSTYTSLSGVKREMKFALPVQIGAGITGFALWVVSRVLL